MPSHYKGTPQEQRVLNTYITLVRATDSLLSHVQKTFQERRLTISQFGVLDALHHLGPMCQSTLAHKILKSSGNMTMVIDNLERRKLVRRLRDRDDRRRMIVTLTPSGEEMIREALPGHVSLIRSAFVAFSDKELELLGDLTKKLGRTLNFPVRTETMVEV